MHLDIPDGAVYAAVGTIALISATQLIRFIRWQGGVLTVKDHEKICTERQTATKTAFESVATALKKQDEDSIAWRTRFDDKMDTNHNQNRGDIGDLKDQVGEVKLSVSAVRGDLKVLETRVNALQPTTTTVNVQGG